MWHEKFFGEHSNRVKPPKICPSELPPPALFQFLIFRTLQNNYQLRVPITHWYSQLLTQRLPRTPVFNLYSVTFAGNLNCVEAVIFVLSRMSPACKAFVPVP